MQDNSQDGFQIATLVVATLAALIAIFYLLIFLNPRIAFNPFKPPLPSPTFLAVATLLPPTWTPMPTLTDTPILTITPPATSTPTLAPATATPIDTATIVPRTPTRTPVPPSPTSATPIPSPTRSPSPTGAAPTLLPSPYAYRAILSSCTHSGGTQIKGTVSSGGQPQEGVRVRVATGPDAATVVEEQFTRRQSDGSAGFAFVLRAIGAFETPATWYIWLVDATGNPMSDSNFHFQTNNYPQSNALSCWLAVVDFVK